ncbi:hypothetical protein BJV78DRAFT_811027 [Lactifluus subvellereus]|nr:hypothetical protein BJV78DRAFT_811027 [Lactifluus subvellereus]
MQSLTSQTSMSNPPPFIKFLVSCLLARHLDPVEKVLHEHFQKRSQTLANYLSLTLSNFENQPPPPPHDAACTNSHRLGLNMSPEKFRMAKSFLYQCYIASGTLANVLHLKLSPYVVMYAAMDLDVPLPDDFDKWFLWRHIEQLLQLGRTADLVDDTGELPPLLHVPTIPSEYKVNVTEDPDGVLQGLYHFHHHAQTFHSSPFPESKRPLSELPPIQLSISITDRGTAGEMCSWNGGRVRQEWFGLRRQPSDPAFELSREAYAILDATCCWGLAWRGRTVRVNLSNQRLVWALNDFIDASAEFPVVEVLLSLAARCGFEFMAIHAPLYLADVDRHAQGQYNKFSEGSGLVLQLMDVVLSDVPFAKGNLCDLEDVVLSTYRAILVACGARGYTEGVCKPGLLFSEMRNRQTLAMMDDDNSPARRSQPRRRPINDPVTHSSPPDWQQTLQRRLEGRAPDAFNGVSADSMPTTSLCGGLVAMRVEEPLSVPILHFRRTPEETIEVQKCRARKIVQARESAMRLRVARDDAGGEAIDMSLVMQWCGSRSD